MTEADRRLLTEFLGEKYSAPESKSFLLVLKEAKNRILPCRYRTFTTGNDMVALKNKLVEKEIFIAFLNFVHKAWGYDFPTYEEWLMNPERFCQLVCSYLKETP